MSRNLFFESQKSLFALAVTGIFSSAVFAQVDAGTLQQGLEKQLLMPSPLVLAEPERGAAGQTGQAKSGEVRFTVTSFELEGVRILPEAEGAITFEGLARKASHF